LRGDPPADATSSSVASLTTRASVVLSGKLCPLSRLIATGAVLIASSAANDCASSSTRRKFGSSVEARTSIRRLSVT
jgi:hypothetical protein